MSDITAAADETAATTLMHNGMTTLGTVSRSGSSNLGPFTASYSASGSLANGTVDLIVPNVVRLNNVELHYALNFTFSLDLNRILPHICLPRVCIPFTNICTPRVCITWPTISVSVGHSGVVRATANFGLNVHQGGGNWLVDVTVVSVSNLQLDAEGSAIIAAIGVALALVLAPIPFIGPFLALATSLILGALALATVTGWLGPILTPFIAGRTINIYSQPRTFPLLPAGGPIDPPVNVTLANVTAAVENHPPEDELVIRVDIA